MLPGLFQNSKYAEKCKILRKVKCDSKINKLQAENSAMTGLKQCNEKVKTLPKGKDSFAEAQHK